MGTGDTGVALFQRLYAPSENTVISPMSLCMVLSLAANLAGGKTREEFEALLCGEQTLAQLNQAYAEEMLRSGQSEDVNFSIANAMYLHQDLQGTSDFILTKLREDYKADLRKVDFSNPAVLTDLNAWVSDVTQGKIPKLIEELDPYQTAVLLNALYFKGDWEDMYESDATRSGVFHNLDGTEASVDFMRKEAYVNVVDTPEFVGVMDSYKGGEYAFVALMPKGDYNAAINNLSYERLCGLLDECSKRNNVREIALRLPKFKVETPALSVVDTLRELGLSLAFTADADFVSVGKMPDGATSFIGQVLHKATFEVDEKGTEAAAATAVALMRGMSIPAPLPKITFDEPFIYGIVDMHKNFMFLGSLSKLA